MTDILSLRGAQLVILTIEVYEPRFINSICDSSDSRTYKSVSLCQVCYTEEWIVLGEVGRIVVKAKNEFLFFIVPADLP